MKTRGRIVSFVLAVLGIVLAISLLPPHEPVYQGKRLSVWLKAFTSDTSTAADWEQAREAVRAIGPNALPILMEKLEAEDTRIKEKLLEFSFKQSLFQFHFAMAAERRSRAQTALSLLGPLAKPAIPRLVSLLTDTNAGEGTLRAVHFYASGGADYRYDLALDCAQVLAAIGPEAVPPLTMQLTNADKVTRHNAAFALGGFREEGKPALPALIRNLRDEDDEVRGTTLGALVLIDEATAIASLIECLSATNANVRQFAAETFGKPGWTNYATSAIPALSKATEDENENVRSAAEQSLKQINSTIAQKAEVK